MAKFIEDFSMKKMSELFHYCAYEANYINVDGWVSYAFVENGNSLEIYWQGSYETEDWISNFWFFPKKKKPYKEMEDPYKVHSGFLFAWKKVEDLIHNKITEVDETGNFKWKDITIVGYSHGGALTFFSTEMVWYYREDLRENGFRSFAFESPRVFSGWHIPKKLKERWANMTVVRTGCDIVTHCPPWLFRFCHAGKMIKLEGDISLVEDKIPFFIKYHFPQVVYDALLKEENK